MSEANNGGRGDRAMAAVDAKEIAEWNDEAAVGWWVDLASYFLPLTWGKGLRLGGWARTGGIEGSKRGDRTKRLK